MKGKVIYCILTVIKPSRESYVFHKEYTMFNTKTTTILLSILLLFALTGCDTPSFGKKVEKEFYTGGKLRSTFTWSDSKGKSGIKRTFGYEGHMTSSVHIKNGVKNGIMSYFDKEGRVIKQTPYVNGMIQGVEKAFYPNGDKMISYTYREGMKNGYAYTYYPDGHVCRKAKYKNNVLIN